MNTLEAAAYYFLTMKYDANEIVYTKGIPDFLTDDGKRWEAKLNYNGKIIFYETHQKLLKDSDYIIVVDPNKEPEYFDFFMFGTPPKKYELRFVKPKKRPVYLDAENYEKLKKIGDPEKVLNEIIRRLEE